MLTPHRWRDTQPEGPPIGDAYASAAWLLGRHDQLAALAASIPGVVDTEDGEPWIELDWLAAVVTEFDRRDGTALPRYSAAVRAFGVMSDTEQARLRLLAVFATTRVPLRAWDVSGFDEEGQRLLADWCQALQAH